MILPRLASQKHARELTLHPRRAWCPNPRTHALQLEEQWISVLRIFIHGIEPCPMSDSYAVDLCGFYDYVGNRCKTVTIGEQNTSDAQWRGFFFRPARFFFFRQTEKHPAFFGNQKSSRKNIPDLAPTHGFPSDYEAIDTNSAATTGGFVRRRRSGALRGQAPEYGASAARRICRWFMQQ